MDISHQYANQLGTAARRVNHALKAVWAFAAALFVTSSLFFYLVAGVAKMMFPLAFISVGIGIIGTVKVFATDAIAKRREFD